jgi:hypothetical protein
LTIATVVLAAALVFQPATSHAFSFGSIIGLLDQGRGHHYRGKPKRVHHARKGGHHHRGPEKSARKAPNRANGPIFTAAR